MPVKRVSWRQTTILLQRHQHQHPLRQMHQPLQLQQQRDWISSLLDWLLAFTLRTLGRICTYVWSCVEQYDLEHAKALYRKLELQHRRWRRDSCWAVSWVLQLYASWKIINPVTSALRISYLMYTIFRLVHVHVKMAIAKLYGFIWVFLIRIWLAPLIIRVLDGEHIQWP